MKTVISLMLAAVFISVNAFGSQIDPFGDGSKYAYGENVGWFNFLPSQGQGIVLGDGVIEGCIWNENVGWINLSPADYAPVGYDGQRRLSGYAWGENVGWINFSPAYGGVTVDIDGNFDGWAWGENIGWIHFASSEPVAYKVRAGVVNLYDMANFADQWLAEGSYPLADLNLSGTVDLADYGVFASYWLDFCPYGWPLKY